MPNTTPQPITINELQVGDLVAHEGYTRRIAFLGHTAIATGLTRANGERVPAKRLVRYTAPDAKIEGEFQDRWADDADLVLLDR
jgi:hypothetical protein